MALSLTQDRLSQISYLLLPSLLLSLWPMTDSRYVRQSVSTMVGTRRDLVDGEWEDKLAGSEPEESDILEENLIEEGRTAESRTVRRLRAQNEVLKGMLAQCRIDLEGEKGAREVTRKCHEKYLEELRNRNETLEIRVEDLRREVLALRYGNESTLDLEEFGVDGKEREDEKEEKEDYIDQAHSTYSPDSHRDNSDSDSDSDLSSTPDPEAFKTTALAHLAQSTLNNLTPAMMILHFDDLVLKFDPAAAEILTVLARAVKAWCARVPELVGFAERWAGILGRYVPEAEGKEFLVELEIAFTAAPTAVVKRVWMRLLMELYRLDVVEEDGVIAWAKSGEGGLRDLCSRFLEFLERDDDDDSEEEDDGTLVFFGDLYSGSCDGDCGHDSGCDVSDEGSAVSSVVKGSSAGKERKCVRFADVCPHRFEEGEGNITDSKADCVT